MNTLWQDLSYGLRMLLKHRGVTAVAMLTLALGIGANTAIFSVFDALLLRPLPFRDPTRLAHISLVAPLRGGSRSEEELRRGADGARGGGDLACRNARDGAESDAINDNCLAWLGRT